MLSEVLQYLRGNASQAPITIRLVEFVAGKLPAVEDLFVAAGGQKVVSAAAAAAAAAATVEFFTFFRLGEDIFTKEPDVNLLPRDTLPDGRTGIWKPFSPTQSQHLENHWKRREAGKVEDVTMEMDNWKYEKIVSNCILSEITKRSKFIVCA